MARYRYRGFDATGSRVAGESEAESLDLAREDLTRRGVLLAELAPAVEGRDWRATLGLTSDRVGLDELEFMTAELSLLLDSGVRIDRALGILQRAGRSGAAGRLLSALAAEIKKGRQLSEALAEHPDEFDALYVNLVALGEASGRLPEVFRGLAADLRFRRELRQKILQAAAYPLVVLAVCVLALLFIYLVLSAQFESFVHPFVIMLSVPLSMTGALLTLWLAGGTLNIYSQVGLVTLVGLITKHGILIVEFSNQLRAKGEELFAAVVDASTLRLRPILMTTGAMVLGALPLALAHGAGAESRTQIGWVIVGGMSFGTLLTLFVVPTAYTLLAGRHRVAPVVLGQQQAGDVQLAAADVGAGHAD